MDIVGIQTRGRGSNLVRAPKAARSRFATCRAKEDDEGLAPASDHSSYSFVTGTLVPAFDRPAIGAAGCEPCVASCLTPTEGRRQESWRPVPTMDALKEERRAKRIGYAARRGRRAQGREAGGLPAPGPRHRDRISAILAHAHRDETPRQKKHAS
jgi:hypothetical protein